MTDAVDCDSRTALLYEITEIVREEIGFNECFATQIAAAVMRGLQKRNAGHEIYIPAPDKTARNDAIRREFNGTNLAEVMRRHRVSKATVYNVCK